MKFRPHRELLHEAMNEVVEVAGLEELKNHIEKTQEIPRDLIDKIQVKPYGFDARIGWDTHIVVIPSYGVVGFTDSKPKGWLRKLWKLVAE
jgi:hypothetical protein